MSPLRSAVLGAASSSASRSGRPSRVRAVDERPQPASVVSFQFMPGPCPSSIDEGGERNDPAEHRDGDETIAEHDVGRRTRPLLDQRYLQIAQYAGGDERHGEIKLFGAIS